MAEQHVVTKLEDKRKELSRLVAVKERELSKAKSDLRALDSTIRLYKPDHELPMIGARRPSGGNKYFHFGEISDRIRDVIRDWSGNEPPSSNDFIYTIAKAKDIDYDNLDEVSRLAFYRAVSRGFAQSRTQGWLVEDFRRYGMIYWRLVCKNNARV